MSETRPDGRIGRDELLWRVEQGLAQLYRKDRDAFDRVIAQTMDFISRLDDESFAKSAKDS